MLRKGYLGRNPMALDQYDRLIDANRIAGKVADPASSVYGTPSALLTGLSGTGKSYSLEKILKLTPQVIDHTTFNGSPFSHRQLVWLKMDCPSSPKQLCTSFFQIADQLLETNYLNNYWGNNGTVGTMVPGLARVALLHSLGLLVLDEAQNLKTQDSGGREQLLSFIVEIENTLGVPVLFVGNASVFKVFSSGFRQERRATGLLEPHWHRMTETSKDLEIFLKALWKYNYLVSDQPLTDEIRNELYYHTQGVTDYVVKLFQAVQVELMNRAEDEKITRRIIATVAHKVISGKDVMTALRKGQLEILQRKDDICIEDILPEQLPDEEEQRLAEMEEADEAAQKAKAKVRK